MAGARFIIPTVQYMDVGGRPAIGYKLNSYEAGTTTPKVTYSDAALSVANDNPTLGDSNGYFGTIYIDTAVAYKFVLTDADDTVIWTQDNVYSSINVASTANIEDGAVTGVKIAAAVAGDGLAKDGSSNLEVSVDDSTIEISTDTLQVKDAGITTAKLSGGNAQVFVSSNDTTGGRLNGKLVAGAGVSLTEGSDGGDETLTVAVGFKGALVYSSVTIDLASTVAEIIAFNSEEYDTDDFHDNSTNNTRLTVPANVSRVRLLAKAVCEYDANGHRYLELHKNGNSTFAGNAIDVDTATTSPATTTLAFVSPVLSVSENDYFEVNAYQNSGSTLDLTAGSNALWFSIEVVE